MGIGSGRNYNKTTESKDIVTNWQQKVKKNTKIGGAFVAWEDVDHENGNTGHFQNVRKMGSNPVS